MPSLEQAYRYFYTNALTSISSTSELPETPAATQPSDLELSLLVLKILAKLVVYGWGGTGLDLERKAEVAGTQRAFFLSTLPDFISLYNVRKAIILNPANAARLQAQSAIPSSPLVVLNKHVLAYGKMCNAMLHQNHTTFHNLGQTREITKLYWSIVEESADHLQSADLENPASLFPANFIMQSMLLVKYCFTQFPYKLAGTGSNANVTKRSID